MFSALISEDTSSKLSTFLRLHQWYWGKKKSYYSTGTDYFKESIETCQNTHCHFLAI